MARDGCNYFSFWAIFCPFIPLIAQKIKIKKNRKEYLEISSFYVRVPKIIIRWCTVPEIWCVTEVIIFDFGSFFVLLLPWQPKKSKFSWYETNKQTNKKKKTPGDIIILHMCTKHYDQMIYGSWDMPRYGRMDRWTDKQTE